MKIGKLSSRFQRFGQKARGDITKVVGKTSKAIGQVEKGAKKAVEQVGKAADSAAVRGVQQGLGIAGRLLSASGEPTAQALGGSLLSAQEGVKTFRKAMPSKVEKAQSRIGKIAGQAQGKVLEGGKYSTAVVRKGESYAGNVLEKAPPKANTWEELPMYYD